jgi:ABC-type Zn uptake system ZnuABC Zn-binding protein ZnuA
LALAITLACGDDDDAGSGGGGLMVLATTTHLGDFAREVAAPDADVEVLLDANADAHDYEPTSEDARDVAEADVILETGSQLDEWLDELIDNSGGDALVVNTSETIPDDTLDDPHIWFDPGNVLVIVENIAAGLAEADRDSADEYEANAEQYKQTVEEMDAEVAEIFARCEPDELVLVTSHDAFGHLADHYGLTIVGAVLPTDTTAEPSAEELADLITLIEEQDVAAIFSEASVDTEVEEQVEDETGAQVVADLYSDSLGPADSEAATYVDMMRYNAETIVEGLACA